MIQFCHHASRRCFFPVLLQSEVRSAIAAGQWNFSSASSPFMPHKSAQRGLFDVPFYRVPGDFKRAADTAKALGPTFVSKLEHRLPVSDISASNEQSQQIAARYVAWLHEMDGLSNLLCQVLDAAEACRNCHADPAWQSDASVSYEVLCTYMYILNTCRPLYEAMVEVTNAPPAVMQHLTREQKQVAILIRREFENEGIHLPDNARTRLVELTQAAQMAAQEFSANAFQDPVTFELPADSVPDGMGGRTTGNVTIQLTPWLVENVTKQSKDAELRRQITQASAALGASNGMYRVRLANVITYMHLKLSNAVQRLEDLRDRRTELARTIGFESYADMVTCDRMATSPKFAVDFLLKLSQCVLPRALAELADLASERKRHEQMNGQTPPVKREVAMDLMDVGGSSALSGCATKIASDADHGAGSALDMVRSSRVWAWDYNYYSESIRAREFGDPDTDKYFTMEAVLKGLALVTQHVFGVDLMEEALDPAERWDLPPGTHARTSTLRRFRLIHENEGELGTIYFDPFPRAGKYGGAAHFVVSCGKKSHPYDLTLHQALAPNAAKQGRQLPIVALLTNFHVRRNPESPHLESICITDVETLFHEFGHALHSLLSHTEFQHVSGTRGALDFVELPSHVMEYWSRDYRVVKEFAIDPTTGHAIPEDLFNRAQARRRRFRALDMQQSIAWSLFDQALFGGGNTVDYIMSRNMRLQEFLKNPSAQYSLKLDDLIVPLPPQKPEESILSERKMKSLPPLSTAVRKSWYRDTSALSRAMHDGFSFIPLVANSRVHGNFTHFNTYGAGYYSYSYAAVMSAHVWEKLFMADPWSRTGGQIYRNAILSKGGAEDPQSMLHAALGEPLSFQPLLNELAI